MDSNKKKSPFLRSAFAAATFGVLGASVLGSGLGFFAGAVLGGYLAYDPQQPRSSVNGALTGVFVLFAAVTSTFFVLGYRQAPEHHAPSAVDSVHPVPSMP